MMSCPHCGRKYSHRDMNNGLIPNHDWPPPYWQVCPGSGQVPRNAETDRRPLWMDEIERLKEENSALRQALLAAIPWIGENRTGPTWASPDAKIKNADACDKAFEEASRFFPYIPEK